MGQINKIKSISLWIFVIPFVVLNACLILITQFHSLFNAEDIIINTIPYIDGGASISRTARVFPTYLIFKPGMFFTSYLLIKYWMYNKDFVLQLDSNSKNANKFLFFGVASAILLTLHSIFLGIKFDNDLYKLFRRVVMLFFIVFEVVAQAYLVATLYSIKSKIINLIKPNILKLKLILVSMLIGVAIISIPIISMPGNKFLKHALEWNYFIGVITFYLLTHLMWKKTHSHTD